MTEGRERFGLLYGVDDIPPWYITILLALQQFLTCFGATFSFPFIIAKNICIAGDTLGLSELISTVIFVSGLSTIIQATFGIRLPIIQSISYSFIVPVTVLMSLKNNCPFNNDSVKNVTIVKGSDEHRDIWQGNLATLQGSLMVASLLNIFLGFTGLIGFLMRFIGPLTIAPTIALIGISLFGAAADKASGQWWIAFMTMFLIVLFSQYLRGVAIPCPCLNRRLPFFALFPVLLAIVVSWIVCIILTEAGVFPDKESEWGYKARSDLNSDVLLKAKWFRFPYPGQWGVPDLTVGSVLGMMAAMIASMIESVGDYYACARLSGAAIPPGSAISRGIGIEGICCLLAGAWGTVGGNTSYSENIGAIGITKVGSRVVIQTAGLIMLLLGCLGKFGALFVTLPDPIVGGLYFVMFGMVFAVGISNLQLVDLNSTRNIFIFGFSFFFGFSLPSWVAANDRINTGNDDVDQILSVICGTNMFVGGVMAFILDNTIPGTRKERGLLQVESTDDKENSDSLSTYDMPFCQPALNKFPITKYLPFCNGFVGDRKRSTASDEETQSGEINNGFSTNL